MNQIGNIFSQFNYQTQTAPPPPHGTRCAHQQSNTSQIPSSSYLAQLMTSSNNMFGGWQQFAGVGGYANPGFDTSYANPGFDMSYSNPGFGLGTSGYGTSYGNSFGAAGLDMSAFTSLMGNSLFSQSVGYSSGLSGLGLGSLSSSYPGLSTNAFPYELLMQGTPSIPQF